MCFVESESDPPCSKTEDSSGMHQSTVACHCLAHIAMGPWGALGLMFRLMAWSIIELATEHRHFDSIAKCILTAFPDLTVQLKLLKLLKLLTLPGGSWWSIFHGVLRN